MADGAGEQDQVCLVSISNKASSDLEEIFEYTGKTWGFDQADAYLEFLEANMHLAAEASNLRVKQVEEIDGVFEVLCVWKNSRYGHWVYSQRTSNGIHVLRILHTAMDRSKIVKQLDDAE